MSEDGAPSGPPPGIDPEFLERLRRGVPLRMTAMGELLFDGEPITHPRVRQALRDGLDVENGETIVRLGAQWCYLSIDDTPLRATSVDVEDEHVWLRLDDGRRVELDPSTLWEEPGAGLRCKVPSAPTGRPLDARLTNAAQMQLATHIEEDDDGLALKLGERRIPLSSRE